MKHKIKIIVLILTFFSLTGCDKAPEDITDQIEDILPSITIVGDELIIVEQYTTFTDPGAEVTGDYDLEVTVVSDLDTSVLGDYTVTYTIVYEDITYSGTRTVRVIVPLAPIDFGWVLTTASVTSDTIGVSVTYLDADGLLTNGKGSLYQGTTLIDSYDLISGINYLNYTGLHSNLDYKFVIEGTYIDSGVTVTLSGQELNITTADIITMQFNLTNETITYNGYTGDIEITYASSNIVTKKAYLYLGENIVKEVVLNDTDTTFSVTGLLSSTEYVLKVIYTATPADGGVDEEVIEVLKTFSTDTLSEPTFILFLCEVGFTSAECGVGVDATGLTIESLRVELWKDGSYDSTYQVIDSYTYVDITDLDPGTEYNLKLYVDYKVDGSEELIAYTLLHEETITTQEMLSYTAPSIENLVITPLIGDEDKATIEFDFIDPDNTIEGYMRFYLYGGNNTVDENITVGHNILTFLVDPNKEYTFKVKTNYKETEDSTLWNEIIFEGAFVMPPEIEALSFTQEESLYFFGDHIILILELDNEHDMNVEYVTINGKKIYKENFLFPSTIHTIYLSMGVETDYTDYSYHLTDYAVTIYDDSSYTVPYDQEITFRLNQPGDIVPDDAEVSILEITTDDYTHLVSDGVTNTTEITIHLENEYNLEIYSIYVNGQTYLSSEFNTGTTLQQIVLNVELDRFNTEVSAGALKFIRNEVTVDSTHDSPDRIYIYGYYEEDIVLIYTPEQLTAIDTTGVPKYYKLMDNIDMQTITNFSPIGTAANPFDGSFDGNGFTISNLNYTSYNADQLQSDYMGLFGYTTAFLYDITLYNFEISIYTALDYTLYVGTLAGKSYGTIIDCDAFGPNSITINGFNGGYVGGLIGSSEGYVIDSSAVINIDIDGYDLYNSGSSADVGGLIGRAVSNNISVSSSDGTINISNTNNVSYSVGGLVGLYANANTLIMNTISNSYSSVDISTTNYSGGATGGLVGKLTTYESTIGIINSYSTGNVYASNNYVGGLLGLGSTDSYIENSFATGNVSTIYASMNRLVSDDPWFPSNLLNNYVYDMQTLIRTDGTPTTIPNDIVGEIITASSDEYNETEFYDRILGWNVYYYDFSNLNIVNDDLPIHN